MCARVCIVDCVCGVYTNVRSAVTLYNWKKKFENLNQISYIKYHIHKIKNKIAFLKWLHDRNQYFFFKQDLLPEKDR